MAEKPKQRLEFISLEGTSQERLKYVSLTFESLPAHHCRAKVTLEKKPGKVFVGTCEHVDSRTGRLRSAAKATVEAIGRAVDADEDAFELLDLKTVKAYEATAVLVAVSVRHSGGVQRMAGFCVVDPEDPERAAPLAVLNGTNRFLSAVLAGKITCRKTRAP
jgi:hypothetical protein